MAAEVQVAKAKLELLQREAAKRRLMPFVKRFNPKYMDGWVHNDICRRLERFSAAVAAGTSPRLMILMPPRHGKSEIASRNFPPWHLGQYPDHEFIACSYNVSLALDFSRKVKGILADPLYPPLFDTRLDPSNQSAETWGIAGKRGGYVAAGIGGAITGKGAHCLAPGTLVSTVEGLFAIERLYLLESVPDVLTPAGPRRVMAATKRAAPSVYTLRFASGAVLGATGEHPVYLPDQARYATVRELYGQTQDDGGVGVRVVRELVPTAAVRPQQVSEAGVDGVLLQQGLQPGAPRSEERQALPDLREAGRSDPQKPELDLLLGCVRAGETSDPCPQDLPAVLRGVSAETFKAGLLRGELRQYGAHGPYAWGEELELPDGGRIRVLVRPDEASDLGPGSGLRSVPDGGLSGVPPHQRGPQRQCSGESGHPLQKAPCGAPQVGYDTLSVVERSSPGCEFVYDLQVEESGCFFADHILVGNCLVIDDPVKNAEEADSADTREKIWEWYLSTAYSRLAPGGGVLIIQCMTGDTPVLMADKTERRLDALVAGDEIATYASGILASSRVSAIRSNGRDSVLKITTSSGKIVQANQRHPFLTVLPDGGVTWTRAKHLTTAHRIVALKASGASGRELPALRKGVKNLPNVADYAQVTTPSKSGPTDTDRQASTQHRAEALTSNTGTGSPLPSTTRSSNGRVGYAPSAESHPEPVTHATGKVSSLLTTATTQRKSVGCSATTATQESGTLPMSQWHVPPHGISDFTLDEIVSIEQDGEEEVFDLQVEHTENFIANGLVSHNTWWHDDDLAGRIQTLMKSAGDDEYIDQFEVIKYPAIAEADEYLNTATDLIEYDIAPDSEHTRLRLKGEALHPDRYDLPKLLRIKAQNNGGRWWSALYQQNPVPNDGGYFTKDQFRLAAPPHIARANVFIAWDFAISEKKQNDYTVGTVCLQDSDDVLHVADQLRFKSGDAFFIVEAILNLAAKWHNSGLVIGFEDGQIFRALEALLKKRMKERQFYPSTMVLKPITDKLARARALQGRMQQGMVSFAGGAPWVESLKTEMLRFPAGAHDDQVDSLSWAALMAVGRQAPRQEAGKPMKSWKDKLRNDGTLSHMVA